MTSLTIELTPNIYERLRAEAQRQGKAEQMLAQELLTGQLQKLTSTEAPLYRELAPEVQALLAIMTDADMIVPPQSTSEDVIRLLQSWSDEDAA